MNNVEIMRRLIDQLNNETKHDIVNSYKCSSFNLLLESLDPINEEPFDRDKVWQMFINGDSFLTIGRRFNRSPKNIWDVTITDPRWNSPEAQKRKQQKGNFNPSKEEVDHMFDEYKSGISLWGLAIDFGLTQSRVKKLMSQYAEYKKIANDRGPRLMNVD